MRLCRYILYEAEDKGMQLPYACRMGCCTACAVRVKEGTLWQPEALGISAELKEQGYALMCVGYPTSGEWDCGRELRVALLHRVQPGAVGPCHVH